MGRTEQQELELSSGITFVFSQLPLDLGIDALLLLLLLGQAAGHFALSRPPGAAFRPSSG